MWKSALCQTLHLSAWIGVNLNWSYVWNKLWWCSSGFIISNQEVAVELEKGYLYLLCQNVLVQQLAWCLIFVINLDDFVNTVFVVQCQKTHIKSTFFSVVKQQKWNFPGGWLPSIGIIFIMATFGESQYNWQTITLFWQLLQHCFYPLNTVQSFCKAVHL